MEHSTITIKVKLDEEKIPQQIEWNATGTTTEDTQQAKGLDACILGWRRKNSYAH